MTPDEIIECLRQCSREQIQRLLTKPCWKCHGEGALPKQSRKGTRYERCWACLGKKVVKSAFAEVMEELACTQAFNAIEIREGTIRHE